ncbi:MAG: ATP-dependent DNA helicase [Candidatus Thermoplasmatota archaeon]
MASAVFPYAPRPGQEALMQAVASACETRSHTVIESGTGTGKTVCALTACVEQCRSRGKKLLYLTRTNSQQRQVMLELRMISARHRVFGVALQGRRNMCPLAATDEELSKGNPEELSKVCSERKARVLKGDEDACRFYAATITDDLSPVLRWARDELPTAEEFVDHCIDRDLCPYEVCKLHVPAADVVTAPYIMFFDRFIRHALLDWMACAPSDVVVLVDEAHNLPSYARELESADLSDVTLRLAHREIDEFGDPEVAEGTSLRDFVGMLEEVLDKAVAEYLVDEDGIIPQSFVEEELMFGTHLTSRGVRGLISQAANFGEMVRDSKKLAGRLPRSYVFGASNFLAFWHQLDEEEYIKLVAAGEAKALEAYCLDASIACRPLMECHTSIHMSGTLRPLDDYRDSIGLPRDSRLVDVPSPFPPGNRLVLYSDDVTTKHDDIARDDTLLDRMSDRISGVLSQVPRSTIVFYPSYALMERIAGRTAGASRGREVFLETRGMDQAELMDAVRGFKSSSGRAVMHAIAGGRVSEGLDFPGSEMEVALVAGIPYPKPTAKQRALQHFCELRFGDGWAHAVQAPTSRKLQQAIGRLIRSETDRGVALVLDKRIVHFRDTIGARRTDDPVAEMREFFSSPQERAPEPPRKVRRGLQL